MKQTAEHWAVRETRLDVEMNTHSDCKKLQVQMNGCEADTHRMFKAKVEGDAKTRITVHKDRQRLQRFIKTIDVKGFGMTKWNKIQKRGKEYLGVKAEKRWSKEQDHACSHAN